MQQLRLPADDSLSRSGLIVYLSPDGRLRERVVRDGFPEPDPSYEQRLAAHLEQLQAMRDRRAKREVR